MNYKITRETAEPYTNDRLGNFGSNVLYKISDDEKVLGEFFYKNIVSYFTLEGVEYHIPTERPVFKKFIPNVSNKNTGEEVATIKYSSWMHRLRKEVAKIIFNNNTYIVHRSRLNIIKAPLFKSTSTVTLDFYIESEDESILYSMIYESYNGEDSNNFRPASNFNMTIATSTSSLLIIILGLFVIEDFFHN